MTKIICYDLFIISHTHTHNSYHPFLLGWTLPFSIFSTQSLHPISAPYIQSGGSSQLLHCPVPLHWALVLYMQVDLRQYIRGDCSLTKDCGGDEAT